MIALSALIYLPRWLLVSVGIIVVAGHNLLDGIHFASNSVFYIPWSILHEKNWIELSAHFKVRTTYPVLPWIGVIALGYAAGPWFAKSYNVITRRRNLLFTSGLLIIGFVVLRCINSYGDTLYVQGATFLKTLMSFINITKYPPSLLFISLTLGIGLLLLVILERYQQVRGLKLLAVFGSVPMFFYLLHLYVLRLLYIVAITIWGTNQGDYFGFDHVWALWVCTPLLVVALYPIVKWFSQLKARRRDIKWLKYF